MCFQMHLQVILQTNQCTNPQTLMKTQPPPLIEVTVQYNAVVQIKPKYKLLAYSKIVVTRQLLALAMH